MSTFRFVRQLSEESFLEDKGVLRLVRIEVLIQGWLAANQRRGWEIPVRWIIRGDKSQLHVAVGSYRSKMEARAPRNKRSHDGRSLKAPPRICLGLFAAAGVFGLGFVHGAPLTSIWNASFPMYWVNCKAEPVPSEPRTFSTSTTLS